MRRRRQAGRDSILLCGHRGTSGLILLCALDGTSQGLSQLLKGQSGLPEAGPLWERTLTVTFCQLHGKAGRAFRFRAVKETGL